MAAAPSGDVGGSIPCPAPILISLGVSMTKVEKFEEALEEFGIDAAREYLQIDNSFVAGIRMVLEYSIIIFITQIIYIGTRTWNIKTIAKNDVWGAIISGVFAHLSWLTSIAIGSVSMYKIINEFKLEYLPIIICSLIGGLVGTYLALREKRATKSS